MTRPIHDSLVAANERWIEHAVPSAHCPSGDTLWGFCGGELAAEDARAVARHIATCGACAEAVGLARAMDRVPEVRSPAHRWWPLPLALAAAALIVAVLVPRPPVHDGVYRGDSDDASSPEAVVMPATMVELTWPEGPPGSLYDVEVHDDALQLVYDSRGLERASVRIPSQRVANLSDGASLHWRVTTRRPDGTRHVSPTRTVIVRTELERR